MDTDFHLINEPIIVLTCDNTTNLNFDLIKKDHIKEGKPECFLVPVKPVKKLEGIIYIEIIIL